MSQTVRKSAQLGLSFPYDWSNPSISDEALILNYRPAELHRQAEDVGHVSGAGCSWLARKN